MGSRRPRPVVLDAGALIAFERNDRSVRTSVRTLIELALAHGGIIHTPACVVAQVFGHKARGFFCRGTTR